MTGRKVIYHKELSCNNSLSIFFKIPKFTTMRKHVVNKGILSFDKLIRKNVYSFWQRLERSENEIILGIASLIFYGNSLSLHSYECKTPLILTILMPISRKIET